MISSYQIIIDRINEIYYDEVLTQPQRNKLIDLINHIFVSNSKIDICIDNLVSPELITVERRLQDNVKTVKLHFSRKNKKIILYTNLKVYERNDLRLHYFIDNYHCGNVTPQSIRDLSVLIKTLLV